MTLRWPRNGNTWGWLSLGAAPLLLLLIHTALGLRPEHVVLTAACVALSWVGPRARSFLALAAPFVITGLAYDFLRLFIHLRGDVHVGDLYAAERLLFGVPTALGRVALSEVVAKATHPVLDVVTGLVYIFYLVELFAVGGYLWFKDRRRMQRLAWTFALASLLGWITWIAWPAAPPWYVDLHGMGPADLSVPSNPAGGSRFDELLGVNVFASFYARSSNVFGAMPSLHVGYAVLPALATWTLGGKLRTFTAVWAGLMAFSAVYLRHHYILDVLAGIATALVADALVRMAQRAPAESESRVDDVSTEVSA
ncbi:phosphatase PAP2 family protein [Chondromyces crocatus]|uniref:Phosphatidic acid phosphatase n=1 Tax=Chondromyces crocatus TaxID=52 RepID=A0A0K1EUA8_CHOCO|nr:phosphatase PAP2 family protein [Chondromyces crocatus]AKT44213.1 phosphatidic acid phosphatase [Chondromyces crocatus]